jgi:hypothetical protein
VSCYFAWIEEHDKLVNLQQQMLVKDESQKKLSEKAQLERFLYAVDSIIYRPLAANMSAAEFQIYEDEADKWIANTATWILEHIGEKAKAIFLKLPVDEVPTAHILPQEPINERHSNIMLNLMKYRETLTHVIFTYYGPL